MTLTPNQKLVPARGWRGEARAAPPSAVLGGAPSASLDLPLRVFAPADTPIVLKVAPAPAAVLGPNDLEGELQFRADQPAAYALVQEVELADGRRIYDVTLPKASSKPHSAVLGGGPATLKFPVHTMFEDGSNGRAGVLGVGDVVGSAIGNVAGTMVVQRVLQVIRTPLDQGLTALIRRRELRPAVRALARDWQALDGADGWRSLLAPGAERRVLLFIHGFGSSSANSGAPTWLPKLAEGYDAVLAYDHPSITYSPEDNARRLLDAIPDDLQLSVDIVAHSRGGLVARSLVDLLEPRPSFTVRRIITNGTPHNGTLLADPERWDRLVSIGLTAASWLATTAGAAVWIPKLLELVLKAAAQSAFALPGIEAMRPGGAFVQRLNAPGGLSDHPVLYSAVESSFTLADIADKPFQQAFRAFTAQSFFGASNDLVVPTDSMTVLDSSNLLPAERRFKRNVDHFSYFADTQGIDFIREQLR